MNNYTYTEAQMAEVISQLQSIKGSMDGLAENIKTILRDKLMAEGIVGSTADVLLETFDAEVVKPIIGYSEVSDAYISQNQQVKDLADETSRQNQQIAGM